MHLHRAMQKIVNLIIKMEANDSYMAAGRKANIGGRSALASHLEHLSISNEMPESGGGGVSLVVGESPEAISDDDDGGDSAEDPDPRRIKPTKHLHIHPLAQHIAGASPRQFRAYPPLEQVTRPAITTSEAAYYLNRAEQTLRIWSCKQIGAIRPIRINGRLAWLTADIKRVLGVV